MTTTDHTAAIVAAEHIEADILAALLGRIANLRDPHFLIRAVITDLGHDDVARMGFHAIASKALLLAEGEGAMPAGAKEGEPAIDAWVDQVWDAACHAENHAWTMI